MIARSYSRPQVSKMQPSPISFFARAVVVLCCGVAPVWAAPPDWLQAASRETLPKYADDVRAVMLRNDQVATVKNNGEITTLYRRAYRILRPEGRSYGTVEIYYDSETLPRLAAHFYQQALEER